MAERTTSSRRSFAEERLDFARVPAARTGLQLWSGTMAEADQRDRLQWLTATPRERMEALEYVRALNYGYAEEDQPRPRLQRVYQVAELRRR